MAPFVPLATVAIIGFTLNGVKDNTGAGVVPAVPELCPPFDLTAEAPVPVIFVTLKTTSPPPVEEACDAVKIVDEAAGIVAVLTHICKLPVVENPVLVEST